ncbi:hypothetical protein JMJ35_005559 [Cladonia borealis]|uniref:Uncharacterized protein n=1 Tax=Cladonia borealis TaxID=184061 RepID=A0AA39R1P7_9LECA|nr:hypothetical protein JMJ35_005559 [Cladonia borealis]
MRIPQYDKPLPTCEGPKLKPFHDLKAIVKLKRLLSNNAEGHAHVFEATIGSKSFAIKIFKFYDIEEDRAALLDRENEQVSDDLLRAHSDPFYNECRAYGRLEEKKLNGKVAVYCYGYITISADKEDQLEREFDVVDWDRPGEEYDKPVSQRQPFRAIVKDLVLKDVPLSAKIADKMLTDLRRIRRTGVYPGDIVLRNYKAGLLIDFSTARTEPFYLFNLRPGRQTQILKDSDLYMWERIRKENKLDTRKRAVRDEEYCANLRLRKKVARTSKK